MEKVLVTGGAGFIGSHLVESLLALDNDVLVVDDFSLGRHQHLEEMGSASKLTVVEGDIRNPRDLGPIEEFAPDTVFHMAAIHFIPYCHSHPQEALDVNVIGLNNVVRAVRCAPVKTFVFPSSGAIYGFGSAPWSESAPPRPDEIYGLSKWLGEQILSIFHEDHPQVRTVVARLFNTYGPRETNPHVLPDIMNCIRDGRTIELGNLWPMRDLIYVTDTTSGLIATVDGGPGLHCFNVGTGIGSAINDVLQTIERIRGKKLDLEQVSNRVRKNDGHLISNPRKLMETGWTPKYSLLAGLTELLAWEGLL